MTFWTYLNTGIFNTKSKRHKKFIYWTCFVAFLLGGAVGALTDWITSGSIVISLIAVAAMMFSVYFISYIIFTETEPEK